MAEPILRCSSHLNDSITNLHIVELVIFEFFRNRLSHIVVKAQAVGQTGKTRFGGKSQTISESKLMNRPAAQHFHQP